MAEKGRETAERFRESRERTREEWERTKRQNERRAEEDRNEREERERKREQLFWEEQSRSRAREEQERQRNPQPQREWPHSSYRRAASTAEERKAAGGGGASASAGASRDAGNGAGTKPAATGPPRGRAAYLELLGFRAGVDPTEDELKKAYRAMAMRWHPDRPHNCERVAEATEKFQVAKDAYEYFMEDHRRKMR